MGTDEATVAFASASILEKARETWLGFRNDPKIKPILDEKKKRGGYLCVAEHGYGIFMTVLIGAHPKSGGGTFDVVGKKAKYLLDNPDKLMSREGRNPADGLWGGGISIPGHQSILAFSGLPEHLDELFVLVLAGKLRLLDRAQILDRLRQFPNDYAKLDESDALFV